MGDKPTCVHCHRRIHQQRNGGWYHDHNGSVSCKPGWNSMQAVPR